MDTMADLVGLTHSTFSKGGRVNPFAKKQPMKKGSCPDEKEEKNEKKGGKFPGIGQAIRGGKKK